MSDINRLQKNFIQKMNFTSAAQQTSKIFWDLITTTTAQNARHFRITLIDTHSLTLT